LLLVAGGCGEDSNVPAALLDGSSPPKIPVELEGVAHPVLTRVAVLDVGKVVPGSAVGACLGTGALAARPPLRAVHRIGVSGESMTLRRGSGLHGCDRGRRGLESDRRWCGLTFANLYGSHLRDPRLDLGCTSTAGGPMGFAWVEPQLDTRYVGVEQPGYVEVYTVASGLPVRVSTIADVEIEGSRASFRISEHDAAGAVVRRYVLNAAVAG
jgi:hypothetical protein